MTILTGDFAIDSSRAEHRAVSDCPADQTTPPDTDLTLDAQLYLRHVENGEAIRALAREAGCHASTILRRIRRFEARRDDPLVDGALASARCKPPQFDERHALRVLRRLSEPGAMMASAAGMDKAIVTRDDIRTAVLDRHLAEEMALRGWVVQSGKGGRLLRYVLAPAGRDALRQMLRSPRQRNAVPGPGEFVDAEPVACDNGPGMAEAPAGFDHAGVEHAGVDHAGQHRVWDERVIKDPENGRRRRARVNIAEAPLLLLARRRDGNGQPFLSPGMVAAGERLREDFELAQMGPRVTQNWDGFMTAGIDLSRHGGGHRGGSETARDRVALALRDLGPGMGDIVLRVCCFLEGIELTEQRLGWSARSGKIVLRLALLRLERHYTETYGKGSPLIG
jgi:transposase-like protein